MEIYEPAQNMRSKMLIPDHLVGDILKNAEFFHMNSSGLVAAMFGSTYDMVSYFTHKNGTRYGIVHTLCGHNYRAKFEESIRDRSHVWCVCVSEVTFKRDCVKKYLADNGCSDKWIYNIIEAPLQLDSDDDM